MGKSIFIPYYTDYSINLHLWKEGKGAGFSRGRGQAVMQALSDHIESSGAKMVCQNCPFILCLTQFLVVGLSKKSMTLGKAVSCSGGNPQIVSRLKVPFSSTPSGPDNKSFQEGSYRSHLLG